MNHTIKAICKDRKILITMILQRTQQSFHPNCHSVSDELRSINIREDCLVVKWVCTARWSINKIEEQYIPISTIPTDRVNYHVTSVDFGQRAEGIAKPPGRIPERGIQVARNLLLDFRRAPPAQTEGNPSWNVAFHASVHRISSPHGRILNPPASRAAASVETPRKGIQGKRRIRVFRRTG